MTRMTDSVPDGRTRSRPLVFSIAWLSLSVSFFIPGFSKADFIFDFNIQLYLWESCHLRRENAQRLPGLAHEKRNHQRGQNPVACGVIVEKDYVSRLLAADYRAGLLHVPEHVFVADRRTKKFAALGFESHFESFVAENCSDHRVGGKSIFRRR